MTAVLAPFGFQPVRNGLNGPATGQEALTIASAYATQIFMNDPVTLQTDGTLGATAATNNMCGMFEGCEYTTSDGYYRIRSMWTAAQALLAGTECIAYFIRNPFQEYHVQSAGSVAKSAIGDGADVVIGTGNLNQGTSTSTLSTTLGGAGGSKQFRIVGLAQLPNNAWGDSFTIVRVIMNQVAGLFSQFGSFV